MSSSSKDNIPGPVSFKKAGTGQFPRYSIPDSELSHGASLGNKRIWVNTESTGHVERVFCNEIGRNLLGSMIITYAVSARVLLSSSPEYKCLERDTPAYALLEPDGSANVEISPFTQRRSFELPGELQVKETVMVPKLVDSDPPAVLQQIEVSNHSDRESTLLITVYVNMQGDLGSDLVVNFNDDLEVLEIYNKCNPQWARIVGSPGCTVAYRTTRDLSAGYARAREAPIKDTSQDAAGPFGEIQITRTIQARGKDEATVVGVVSSSGMESARQCYTACSDYHSLSRQMTDAMVPALSTSMVETPQPIINQGVFWAKVNMLKVIALYPQGLAFTNEPGKSVNVVARDVAWFVYGCDFMDPGSSREMLLKFAEKQYESGKIPEYYNALDGHVEDYGLSMNDDTPLFILACCHHYSCTSDGDFLNKTYPQTKKAAEYILSRIDERGLVISDATGSEVRGIASWRNVIPGYQINGAVTEINSECYAALKSIAGMCEASGDVEDAIKFNKAADDLRESINTHLLNSENGLYYLNIDSAGVAHTDVTADEIFPVLFGVAPQDVANRIIGRFRAEDFMTSAGLRTVSRNSPDYDPSTLVGLKGGVWPGVAFWYAFAAADVYPQYMVSSLYASYLQYLLDPLKNNTVPGQFSEWFDGDALVNRGMRLSPWEPPRLLWAAVEGLCGVKTGRGRCLVSPKRPGQWTWLGLRRMPYAEQFLTFFATFGDDEVCIYSNLEVDTPHTLVLAGEDVSNRVLVGDYRVHRVGFTRDGELTICLGSEENAYTTFSLILDGLLEPSTNYEVFQLSRASGWVEIGMRRGEDLSNMAVNIEDGEYRIIKIQKS